MMTSDPVTARAEKKLEAAIASAREQLAAASAAAHELEPTDEDEAAYNRSMWTGMLVETLPLLCGPRIRVLLELAVELLDVAEEEAADEHRHAAH
jgi:hypothetical protein